MTIDEADLDRVDQTLSQAEIVVVAGTGGVGKTTTSAAIGVRAALQGRRVILVTVDPARRLADALGVTNLVEEPILVPLARAAERLAADRSDSAPGPPVTESVSESVSEPGRLWALMVDMSRSWDRLVQHCAPDDQTANEVLDNPLYRSLTTNFVQSHDYIALDRLNELVADERFDLVVIDTPPSGHVLDLLDAPGRLADFFDGRLVRLLTGGTSGRGLGTLLAKPFEQVALRLLGAGFLSRVSGLFVLLSRLGPSFARRSADTDALLDRSSTRFVLVTGPRFGPGTDDLGDEYAELVRGLARRRRSVDLVVVNRSVRAATDWTEVDRSDVEEIDDASLRAAVEHWLDVAESERLPGDGPTVTVPLDPTRTDGVEGLSRFFV